MFRALKVVLRAHVVLIEIFVNRVKEMVSLSLVKK